MTVLARTCLDCGTPQRHGDRCALCDRAYQRRRRANPTDRGYDAPYRRQRAALIAAEPWCHTRPACPYPDAGTPTNPLTADHVIPLSVLRHGSPLVVLCRSCNSAKGNRMPADPSPDAALGRGGLERRDWARSGENPSQSLSHLLRDDSR